MKTKLQLFISNLNTAWGRGLFAFLLGIVLIQDATAAAAQVGAGYVDSANYSNGKLTTEGWAGAESAAQQIVAVKVLLDGKKVYEGPFERLQRPDVATAMGRGDWLRSGWKVSFKLDDDFPSGSHSMLVEAIPDAGTPIKLSNSDQVNQFILAANNDPSKSTVRATKLIIGLSLIILVIIFFYAEQISKNNFRSYISPQSVLVIGVLASFIIAVGLGLTGSSLNLGTQQSPFIQSSMTKIWGKDQPIRSDEWLVLTPLAIGQYNHTPRNPIINTNHGEDGQNMLIVGMTGVPVAHISELAKPATWGFFLFDLKRALAWNWCFPFFGCLLTLWAVLCVLIPNQWRANFVASLIFNISPYIVGWSHWPAYTAFFPCAVFLSALKIAQAERLREKIVFSVILGLSFAGFVFVLYPPWQVSLAYLFIAITLGVVIRDKVYRKIDFRCLAAYFIAACIAALLIVLWWVDAKSAIEAMENTVYPGQRTTVLGGNLSLPFILRGFTNIETLQGLASPLSNQSEISSFYYMFLPLAVAFAIAAYRRTVTSIDIGLAIFISFTLFFMLVGMPETLAKFSLWGRVPSNRADLSLGLGTALLSSSLLSKPGHTEAPSIMLRILGALTALAWTYAIYRCLMALDDSITQGLNSSIISAILIISAAISYKLVTGNLKHFLYLNLALAAATTLTMNPLSIAPKRITNTLLSTHPISLLKTDKILLLNNMLPSMYLVASGAHTVNGIYYYPQSSIWKRIDPQGTAANTYNRYQHLFYTTEKPSRGAPLSITSPQPDVVKVNIDPTTFDFTLTGATVIGAPSGEDQNLDKNISISKSFSKDGWSWFRVVMTHR